MLGARDVTRIRRTATAAVGGRPGTPTEVESTISASVQTAGNRVMQLPPAIRDTVSHVCYSYDELRVADHQAGVLADRIEFEGDTFEVRYVYPRTGPSTLAHYEAFMTRLTETG